MPLQNFIDKVGPTVSALWLNAVDTLKFTIFGDATTKAQARTNLTSDLPLEIANGGTGVRTLADLATSLVPTAGTGFGTEVAVNIAATVAAIPTGFGHVISITGTTASVLSSFGSLASVASPIYVIRFTDFFVLTYNATTMILPYGVSISTMAGDACIAEYMGAGAWRVLSYQSNAPYPKNVSTTNSSHIIQASDIDNVLVHTDASNYAYLFPSDATLALTRNGIGREVDIYNPGTGQLTVQADSGATFTSYYGDSSVIVPQYGSTKVRKVANNTWAEVIPSEIGYASASMAVTLGGMSAGGTGTLLLSRSGNNVTITTQTGTAVTGTSNTTGMTALTIPTALRPLTTHYAFCIVQDNGTLVGGLATVATSGVITFGLGINGTSLFTNSGFKGLPAGWSITYPLT